MRDHLEKVVWISVVLIMMMGLVALYSASYNNARVPHSIFFDQLIFAFIGLGIMFLVSNFDYRKFYDAAYILYGITILLLIIVLVSGRHVLGAKRWIEIAGLNFQPSELAKLSIILVLAKYFSQHGSLSFQSSKSQGMIWADLLLPLLMTLLPMLLIFKQPDLGTALLLFGIFIAVLFVAGIRYRYIFGLLGLCIAILPIVWKIMKTYQKERLLVFLNPNIDPLGAGYTITQSKIAVGSGRLFGKGWLSGTQNQLNFLPERHTDFIFSVIGEEWGLFGALIMVTCFFILAHVCLNIAQQTKDRFGFLVAVGVVSILTLQIIINIGMVLGMYPVVGLTLPFVSYGRSSLVVFVVMIGILLNLAKRRSVF